ncbi:MAG: DNA methyltransferase, partial [Armatimonadota bacterium]
MVVIEREILATVQDRESLFRFLKEKLNWQVQPEDPFTYDVAALDGTGCGQVRVSQIVPFQSDAPFVILLAEFENDFRRTTLREILKNLKQQMRREGRYPGTGLEDIILICTSGQYRHVRFAHFEEREGRQPSLAVFGWDRDDPEKTRTVRELNLSKLEYRPGEEPGEWRRRWMEAWDVSAVTKAFYRTYRDVFERVEAMVQGIPDDEKRRLFTQRLFNRLLFIQFLEKKGWLLFQGRTGYLRALREASRKKDENFYRDRLYWVFFHGLGRAGGIHSPLSEPELEERRGCVPFLGGGLFEMEEGDEQDAVSIPDEAFDAILNELFAPYNFTITESAPDDVEVAVDPEMLGKVFEELVTGRHETGSYYTPRPIVAFMCREALKGYLQDTPGGPDREKVARLVDHHQVEGITVPEAKALLSRLREMRVVDPACGSGAYLLGMLYELFTLTRLLDTQAEQATARDDYQRKLQIIQDCLYGVDLDPFAINIARLRLWLSLVVEYEGTDPEPLPNLDFKLEVGDSLTGEWVDAKGQQNTLSGQIKEFAGKKAQFLTEHDYSRKQELRKEIQELREEIRRQAQATGGFEWQVEFAEVWDRPQGGFDAVLANPPYIRQEGILQRFGEDYKNRLLKNAFPEVWTGTADIYVYFYARAVQLLRAGGTLAFISSNKWFRADYGKKLREYIARRCDIQSITDFGELPVFEGAATFPMIFIARKRSAAEGQAVQTPVFTQVKSLEPPYPDVLALVKESGFRLPEDAIRGDRWTLADFETIRMLRRMETDTVPLGEYVKGKIYRGILTGCNEAFVIDGKRRAELIAEDPDSEEIIKPLAVGDDIRRWHIRNRDRWLIVTKIGVEIQRFPAVFRHLRRWRKKLQHRHDKGNHWWELRACQYYDEFEKPKIVFPDIAKETRFTLDRKRYRLLNTSYFMPVHDCFLIGVLNSKTFWEYCSAKLSVIGDADQGGRLRFFSFFVENLPIPRPSAADRAAIEELAQKCLDAKGEGCEEWEREIDERVHFLYFGRSPGEPLRDFQEAMDLRREEVLQLVAHGEGKRLELKESLEWDTREARPNRELVRS